VLEGTVILDAFAVLRKRLSVSSCLSVRLSAWNNSAATGRIFVEYDILVFLDNVSG